MAQANSGYAPATEAQLLRDANVNIFSIGVGLSINVAELNTMASDPDDTHVFTLKSFSVIADIVDQVRAFVCCLPGVALALRRRDTALCAALTHARCRRALWRVPHRPSPLLAIARPRRHARRTCGIVRSMSIDLYRPSFSDEAGG